MARDSDRAVQWAAVIGGVCLGLQILMKAVDKLPYFPEYPLRIGFLLAAGLFVTGGSLVYQRLERRVHHLHGLFHLIEGAVLILSATLLFEKGKVRMPLVILFLGMLFAVLGAVSYWTTPQNRERVIRLLGRWFGGAFVAAGCLVCGFTLAGDRDGWALGIGTLMLAMGLGFLLFVDRLMARFGGGGSPVPEHVTGGDGEVLGSSSVEDGSVVPPGPTSQK